MREARKVSGQQIEGRSDDFGGARRLRPGLLSDVPTGLMDRPDYRDLGVLTQIL